MTAGGLLRRLRRERRGAHALEVTLISAIFFPLSFAVLELGFIIWTQNSMQSAALMGARCAALASPDCPDVPAYVAAAVGEWLVPDSVPASDVTVTTATSCNGSPGTAVIVTVVHSFWGAVTLPWPFSAPSISVTSCYASAT